jgi:hypothetical protein
MFFDAKRHFPGCSEIPSIWLLENTMIAYKFHFTNFTQGWSELLYRNEEFSNPSDTILQNYINRRLELLATTCALVGVRSSNTDTKRDVTIMELPIEGRGGAWSSSAGPGNPAPGLPSDTEDSFTALSLRLSDGNQNYRTFNMLGIPDQIFQGSTIYPAHLAETKSRLNNWIGAMAMASFGGKFAIAGAPGGKIVAFPDKEPLNQLVCLGIKGTVPDVDTLVTLNGVKPFNKLNRQWRVASKTAGDAVADAYIYLANSSMMNTFGPVEGGKYKMPTFEVKTLNKYTISRITPRKTGVPFVTVRGRR